MGLNGSVLNGIQRISMGFNGSTNTTVSFKAWNESVWMGLNASQYVSMGLNGTVRIFRRSSYAIGCSSQTVRSTESTEWTEPTDSRNALQKGSYKQNVLHLTRFSKSYGFCGFCGMDSDGLLSLIDYGSQRDSTITFCWDNCFIQGIKWINGSEWYCPDIDSIDEISWVDLTDI